MCMRIVRPKKVVFTVTCLGKNRSVGRVFFFNPNNGNGNAHIFAVIMLHQHKFCVDKGNRKLKLLITCENFVLFAL